MTATQSLTYFNNIKLIQIGCGGTGSWLVPLVSKLANNIQLHIPANRCRINYTLVDFDNVENRNIIRQNFTNWDIGKNKAQSLMNRYCFEFANINVISVKITKLSDLKKLTNDSFEEQDQELKNLIILFGCGDNNSVRHLLFNFSKKISKIENNSVLYIDSGNLLYHGQIVTHVFNYPEDPQQNLWPKKKKKKALDFKKMFPIENDNYQSEQSCAFFGDQSQAINAMAASLIFINLQKLLIMNEIPPELISFNSSGYSTFEV